MGIKSKLLHVYDKRYKELMIFTIVLLFLAIGVLGYNYTTTGEFVQKGVSLKGGITLTIPTTTEIDTVALESDLHSRLPKADIEIRRLTEAGLLKSIIIEASDTDEDQLKQAVIASHIIELNEDEYTIESMGSTLGASFFRQTIVAVILAFLAMGIVVLITFRSLIPSLFVILAATSDILCTLAAVSLLGMKLTTAGVAAFLMLIGYSVDTDILLTTRVLKRKEGSIFDRIIGSMKTGMTMSLTSFVAALLAYIFTSSDVIKQIMIIIVIGLFFDMLNTWIQNTGILRWHLERKAKKHGQS
ncbi:protein translocase subunit SecF [Candidatus Woesearchaeota archaeon]|nr:protein translocase subunit SecF [Candidatus Woesearchaeota archaeon]MBW3005654.1 protein translocase subunit SecF [Candidatus Woesearchaeota archaeon]